MKPRQNTCLQYSMHYLSRYPKTQAEMRWRLLEKGYPEGEIEETITYLLEYNYLNDSAFVESYVQTDVIKKGKPSYALKAKLLQKHIPEDVIEKVFDQHKKEMIEGMKQSIIREIDKRKKKGENPIHIIQKLQRRGYDFALIQKTIQERAQNY